MGRPSLADRALFSVWTGALTLFAACLFYASMRLQIRSTGGLPLASPNDWSAPLDDVFIHFDFARAIARGHPFEWSEGNGYSSGGSSTLYPFVLAFGYWIGFKRLALMVWAALVACACTFIFLLVSRRLFRDLPRWTSYLAAPAVLGIGVLDWTLFSGMEVAFFLAIWAGAFIAWDNLVRGPPDGGLPEHRRRAALLLGFWCALLVATRPEAAIVVAVIAGFAAYPYLRRNGWSDAIWIGALAAAPAVTVLVVQAVVNRLLTGESAAAGALVKLEINHPYMSRKEVWDLWKFHAEYQLRRVAEYHLSDVGFTGYVPFALAAIALIPTTTRRYAALLLSSAVLWVLVVALNGQVRWQNERYTMPALAWLMLSAALGTAALLGKSYALGRRGLGFRIAGSVATVAALGVFFLHQSPRFRDQVWFFGRASRNIRDQHIRVGRLLRDIQPEPPHRILVGDAGAIPYAADLPALDIIGLGGYRGLPFARATRQGVGAAIELIERMPPGDRPDMMAIYPAWWGTLPLWFGEELGEVPVTGNVICGGASKVLYRPNWSTLESSGRPFLLQPTDEVRDELDFADLVSERAHGYTTSGGVPRVDMKILPNPVNTRLDVWDAGRGLAAGASQHFDLEKLQAGKSLTLRFRVAPPQPANVFVAVDGRRVAGLRFVHEDGWSEPVVAVPADLVREKIRVSLSGDKSESTLFHLWAIQSR